jgi:C_GCAxxG_C_C family probable redox protein
MTPSERRNKAEELFSEGYNCAQAVFLSFCDELDIDSATALKISSSFGGGMGRLREVCGAVSGMFMAAGMLFGYDNPEAGAEKSEHYARLQALAARFRETNGSIICRELLSPDQVGSGHVPEARTETYYKKRPCKLLVGDAAEILQEYIDSQK